MTPDLELHVGGANVVDRPLDLRVTGAPPDSRVTIRVDLVDDGGEPWSSTAVFAADAHGTVDVRRDPAVDGSYRGVDPLGLLWSAAPPAGIDERATLAAPFEVRVSAEVDGGPAVRGDRTMRLLMLAGVAADRVDEDGVAGWWCRPAAGGPFPGVYFLGGAGIAGGEWPAAVLLATHGFAVFAQTWTEQRRGLRPKPFPVESLHDGLRWLRGRAEVNGSRVGAVGVSGGVAGAVLAAVDDTHVAALVGISGFPIPMPATGRLRHSEWSRSGVPVEGIRGGLRSIAAATKGKESTQRAVLEAIIERARARGEVVLPPVERIAGPVLLAVGDADPLVPPIGCELVMERRAGAGPRAGDELVRYPQAGHLGQLPGRPARPVRYGRGLDDRASGGIAAANGPAFADVWQRTVSLLGHELGGATPFRRYVGRARAALPEAASQLRVTLRPSISGFDRSAGTASAGVRVDATRAAPGVSVFAMWGPADGVPRGVGIRAHGATQLTATSPAAKDDGAGSLEVLRSDVAEIVVATGGDGWSVAIDGETVAVASTGDARPARVTFLATALARHLDPVEIRVDVVEVAVDGATRTEEILGGAELDGIGRDGAALVARLEPPRSESPAARL